MERERDRQTVRKADRQICPSIPVGGKSVAAVHRQTD